MGLVRRADSNLDAGKSNAATRVASSPQSPADLFHQLAQEEVGADASKASPDGYEQTQSLSDWASKTETADTTAQTDNEKKSSPSNEAGDPKPTVIASADSLHYGDHKIDFDCLNFSYPSQSGVTAGGGHDTETEKCEARPGLGVALVDKKGQASYGVFTTASNQKGYKFAPHMPQVDTTLPKSGDETKGMASVYSTGHLKPGNFYTSVKGTSWTNSGQGETEAPNYSGDHAGQPQNYTVRPGDGVTYFDAARNTKYGVFTSITNRDGGFQLREATPQEQQRITATNHAIATHTHYEGMVTGIGTYALEAVGGVLTWRAGGFRASEPQFAEAGEQSVGGSGKVPPEDTASSENHQVNGNGDLQPTTESTQSKLDPNSPEGLAALRQKYGVNLENLKTESVFEYNGHEFYDVNQSARNSKYATAERLPTYSEEALKQFPKRAQKLAKVPRRPNQTTTDAHAEIGTMGQAHSQGLRGGTAKLTVHSRKICTYCDSDVGYMARALELDELIVVEKTTGKTQILRKDIDY